MKALLLSKKTQKLLENYSQQPAHGVLLEGERGCGTEHALQYVLDHTQATHKIVNTITPEKKSISIEQIRELRTLIRHKSASDELLFFVIKQAHTMTTEAQNALLKQLEEPSQGTVYVLLSEGSGLLPTIRSRCVHVPVLPVTKEEALAYNHTEQSDKNYLISNGLAGLYADLQDGSTNELLDAIEKAKNLLALPLYKRLILIDELLKSKYDVALFLEALQKVCFAALKKSPTSQKWQQRLASVLQAMSYSRANVQSKLVLDELVTSLG